VSTGCSAYAKHVAVQIEDIGLLVRTTVLSSNADIMDEILDAVNRGCLFALSIAGHDLSTSLYILHGQPEGAVQYVNSKLSINCNCLPVTLLLLVPWQLLCVHDIGTEMM